MQVQAAYIYAEAVPTLSDSGQSVAQRRRVRVAGVVQGVGFRPFVYNLARRCELGGFVRNDAHGVVIEIEGEAESLDRFAAALVGRAPPLARIDRLESSEIKPRGELDFRIEQSAEGGDRTALVPADIATCDDCLRELFEPSDRRFRYPFINCTNCGPRFTIVRFVPYDRATTTMAGFEMCDRCRSDYEDPSNRRFHAEPICCPDCGPTLSLELDRVVSLLRAGKIVAVKGLGGYHLACDAADDQAVARLRERKHREEKPLAVMTAAPELLVELEPEEEALLRSAERPIVLARRRAEAPVAPSIAPGTEWLGVMLPYAPLHHLLCADFGGALVMTSGNLSDEPIAFENEEAERRLGEIADAFLSHDRPIARRCEDSVVRGAFPIRRSRGYAPAAIPLPVAAHMPLVASGAELKSTFCVVRGDQAFISPHLGDLDTELAYSAFRTDLELYLAMIGVEPELLACDLHPDYLSSKWAREQELELVEVQHHHAHAAACLAENGETGPALALVLDGTGFGTDGTIWGGELLRFNLAGFERVAHLDPVSLPGGEAAVREPWRIAAAYLERAERPVPFPDWSRVRESLKVNAPLSSGTGRLFDAAAALLGVREKISYEGQAAIELEQLAGHVEAEPYSCRSEGERILADDLIACVHDDLAAGRDRAEIAAAFHEGVALAFVEACVRAAEPKTVVLSGGCFQNLRLLASTRRRLEEQGFRVLVHRLLPPNDACISFGQAAIAAYAMSR
ncbi:MAG: carbamoyltransferase HypF [Gaiellaceae bacterium]|jgi:hydrogenase maturation protein HypF